MLSSLIEDWARGVARGFARLFAKSPITPNSLTVIGLLLNIPVVYVLANGWFLLGGILIIFAAVFDMLDGALAKVQGKATKFGAFLDSSFDRYGEIIAFCGPLLYYLITTETDRVLGVLLVFAAATGSVQISYVKARAEGLGMECKTGLMPRPERIAIIAIGCIAAHFAPVALIIALWILAVGTHVTAFQRIIYIWMKTQRQLRQEQSEVASIQTSPEVKAKLQKSEQNEDETEEAARKFWSFRRIN